MSGGRSGCAAARQLVARVGGSPVGGGPRVGFETAIATPGPEPYVAVQALNAAGAVIGTSPTIKG